MNEIDIIRIAEQVAREETGAATDCTVKVVLARMLIAAISASSPGFSRLKPAEAAKLNLDDKDPVI